MIMGRETGTISEAIITQEINGYYSRPAIPDKCFMCCYVFYNNDFYAFAIMFFTIIFCDSTFMTIFAEETDFGRDKENSQQ